MKTLQEMLRECVGGDGRAATAVIDVRRDEVRLLLGAVGQHGRIILSIEGDDVRVIYPDRSAPNEENVEAASDVDVETGVRRPVDIDAGEFVDSNNPLRPGENPADAPARIEAEGLSARQPEAVSTTTALDGTTGTAVDAAPDSTPAAASEVKNPQPSGSATATLPPIDPASHSKEELLEIAKNAGIAINPSENKAAIAAAINDKRSAAV